MDLWDIPQFEGLYALDRNTNQVWSFPKKCGKGQGFMTKGRFMKNSTKAKGYYHVTLLKDGVEKKLLIHRLIYASRHPEFDLYDTKTQIDHVERDITDNENIRACSRSQNMMNCHRPNKSGHRYIKLKSTGSPFEVQIPRPDNGKRNTKRFKTLEEAISHRNEMLPEIKGDQMEYLPKDYLMEVYGKDFA